jgi:NADH:ubiquinone oxidoreductase subunit E
LKDSKKTEHALYKKLKAVIDEKKKIRNPLIEILREAQEIFGYLPIEVQSFIAEELNIPINEVYGVVTFYNFFSMEPRGKHIINVCLGTACYVKGANRVIQLLEEELGIKMGETTQDNNFTLTSVRCVGACSLAPVMVIGEETFGRINSRKKIQEVLNSFKN